MISFPYIQVTPVLDAEPADESSSSNLENFKHKKIQENRHRDREISATFHHIILRGEKDIDDLVINREGCEVPSSWLGNGFYVLVFILFITGLPLFGMLNSVQTSLD